MTQIIVLMLMLLVCRMSLAVEYGFNGFGTLGLSKLDSPELRYPTTAVSDDWSYKSDTRLGVQGVVDLSDRLSGTVQVVSRAHSER